MRKSKPVLRFLTVLLITGGAPAETVSTNTEPSALSEPFEIKAYSPKTGVVKIQCGTAQTNRSFTSFSAVEQQEITAWLVDKEFQGSGLRIEVEKKTKTYKWKPEKEITKSRVITKGEIDSVWYIITLENCSKVDFKDLAINSRIFYMSCDSTNEYKMCSISSQNITLPAGESRTIETKNVLLRDESIKTTGRLVTYPSGDTFLNETLVYNEDRLIGLSVCVSKKDRNGKIIQVETEAGRVPKKESWDDYKQSRPGQLVPFSPKPSLLELENRNQQEKDNLKM